MSDSFKIWFVLWATTTTLILLDVAQSLSTIATPIGG